MPQRAYVTSADIPRMVKYIKRFGPLTTLQIAKAFPVHFGKSLTDQLRKSNQVREIRRDDNAIVWEYCAIVDEVTLQESTKRV